MDKTHAESLPSTATGPLDAGEPPWPPLPVVTPAPPVVHTIPGYDLLGEIHRGGQGIVYQAVQQSTKRVVAVKVLLAGALASPRQRIRFEREIDLAAGLRHPNIITIYDSGVTPNGLHYFAMEYIDGKSMRSPLTQPTLPEGARDKSPASPLGSKWSLTGSARSKTIPPSAGGEGKARGAMPLRDVLRLFAKVCSAVHYAHQRGVIHRDLKPGNILIDAQGEPHVLDFGLAKQASSAEGETRPMTLTGEFLGTLTYAAPEQVRGDPHDIDVRTDIYSLGIILHELLTGHYPYELIGPLNQLFDIITATPPTPPSSWQRRKPDPQDHRPVPPYSIDEGLDAITLKALAKEPADRYQSAGAFAEDIGRYLAGEPVHARPANLRLVMRSWLRRNSKSSVWVLLIGMLCGGLARWDLLFEAVNTLRQPLLAAQAHFPDLVLPLPAQLALSVPPEIDRFLYPVSYAAFAALGFLLAWALRPRQRDQDIAVGMAGGLTAAIMCFTLNSYAWVHLLLIAIRPVEEDLALLDPETPAQQAALVQKYPELAGLPPPEQRRLLRARVIAYLTTQGQHSIRFGLWYPLALFAVIGVWETSVAGELWRRKGRWGAVLFPYLELVIPMVPLVRHLFLLVAGAFSAHGVHVVLLSLVLALAATGLKRGWPWPLRAAVYLAFFHFIVRLDDWQWQWTDGMAIVGAAVALALAEWSVRQRRTSIQ